MTRGAALSCSERIRSHFGAADIDEVSVEIMCDIQKRTEGGAWDDAPDLNRIRGAVLFEKTSIPVPSLEYEFQAYLKLGRTDNAEVVR